MFCCILLKKMEEDIRNKINRFHKVEKKSLKAR